MGSAGGGCFGIPSALCLCLAYILGSDTSGSGVLGGVVPLGEGGGFSDIAKEDQPERNKFGGNSWRYLEVKNRIS